MTQSRGLGDLVPIILNRTIPELASQRFVRGTGRAVLNAKSLYFIECIVVRIAGQCRRRARPKLAGAVQGEWGHLRPLCELRLRRKVGWCRLIVSGRGSESVRAGWRARTVVASQAQNQIRDPLSNCDTLYLIGAIRDL